MSYIEKTEMIKNKISKATDYTTSNDTQVSRNIKTLNICRNYILTFRKFANIYMANKKLFVSKTIKNLKNY